MKNRRIPIPGQAPPPEQFPGRQATRLERQLLFGGSTPEEVEGVLFSPAKSDEVARAAMLYLIENRAGPYARLADMDPESQLGSTVMQETFRSIRAGRVERSFR